MDNKVEQLINEYEKNIENTKEHFSYINSVREFNGYIFKKMRHKEYLENEEKWLKKLMNMDYCVPKLIGVHNNIIITEKIDGETIRDDKAQKHLYNIGQLIANLHNVPIEQKEDWKKRLMLKYIKLKESAKDIMETNIFELTTNFLEQCLENIKVSNLCIVHKDIRPENIIFSNGKYYLIDLESMCIGDRDYDFTRILNLLNQKEFYCYEDFKNLIDGYRSIKDVDIKEEKWQFYNRYYAFRLYSRMLSGEIDRDNKYEKYLKDVLLDKNDRVTDWIKKYNVEESL